MAKLLINDNNKVLVGSNGKAYAVGNMDALKGSSYPVDFTAAAGRVLKLMRYGKCEQSSTPTPSAPVDIVCNNGAIRFSPNMANVNEQTARVGYYISSQGAVLADIYNWFYQNFIPCKPNTTYTLSMSQPVYYVTISEYSTADDSGFIIRKTGSTGNNTRLTITTGDNTNFIRFGTNIDRTVVTLEEVLSINWMLVPGSSAVPYIPYVEGGIYIDGTPEVLALGAQTASVADLLAVGDYVDEQDIINGKITRRCGICIYDGSQTIGDVFLSNTGGKDNGAIIVYPLATPVVEEMTPQPLNTSSGQNTITDVAEVSNPELYIIHKI